MKREGSLNILEVGNKHGYITSLDTEALEGNSKVQIESVNTLSDGLTQLNITNVDCIVSAYNLPDGDGVEFLKTVRKECSDLPFVLYVDDGNQTIAAEAVSAGVTEYVPSELYDRRSEVLNERVKHAIEKVDGPSHQNSWNDSRRETAIKEPPHFVFVLSPEGVVRSVNPSVMDYFDTTIERVTGSLFWETQLYNEEVKSKIKRYVNQIMDGEDVERISSAKRTGNSDTPIEVRSTTDENGETSALIVVGQKVAERNRNDGYLSKTKEQLTLALNAVDGAVWEMDLETEELHWDERAQRLWGYEPGEFTGTFEEFKDPVHSDDWERLETAYRNAIEQCSSYEITIRIKPDEASMRWVRAAGQVVTDDTGEPARLIGFSLDVTESKKREQMLQRKTERLDEFAGVVSHDLQNPLNIAYTRAEMLQQYMDDQDRVQDHIIPLIDSLERIEAIISDTLTLARNGKIIDEMNDIKVVDLVEDCWAGIETDGATLKIDDEFTIHGDRGRLKHVFENLFSNAIDHGGDDVTVRVGRTDEGSVYVEDDGPGIAVNDCEEVFEPGYSSASDGTGFGLTIVKRIIEAHGWTISVINNTDHGARFEFGRV